MAFKPPKWYGDQSLPIVGKKNSTENEKLRVMLGNLCEFVMQNHPELTSEELKAIMKGKTNADVESPAGATDPTVS